MPRTETNREFAFIVGHYKAGSTWLLRLLSHHPDVRTLDETQIFRRATNTSTLKECTRLLYTNTPWSGGGLTRLPLYRTRKFIRRMKQSRRAGGKVSSRALPGSLLDMPVLRQRSLHARLSRCATQEEYFWTFFRYLHDYYRPRRHLVEKTPMNIHCVPLIRSVFPEAKMLAIYRDGRDVVVSDKFYSAQMRREWTIEKSARRWREAMEAQIEYARPHRIHTLSYEALQGDGPGEVRTILEFLGLPSDDGTIATMVERSSFKATTGRRPGDERPDRFNRKGVVGDWRNNFSEEDKAAFKSVAGDLLIRLGYEEGSDW